MSLLESWRRAGACLISHASPPNISDLCGSWLGKELCLAGPGPGVVRPTVEPTRPRTTHTAFVATGYHIITGCRCRQNLNDHGGSSSCRPRPAEPNQEKTRLLIPSSPAIVAPKEGLWEAAPRFEGKELCQRQRQPSAHFEGAEPTGSNRVLHFDGEIQSIGPPPHVGKLALRDAKVVRMPATGRYVVVMSLEPAWVFQILDKESRNVGPNSLGCQLSLSFGARDHFSRQVPVPTHQREPRPRPMSQSETRRLDAVHLDGSSSPAAVF